MIKAYKDEKGKVRQCVKAASREDMVLLCVKSLGGVVVTLGEYERFEDMEVSDMERFQAEAIIRHLELGKPTMYYLNHLGEEWGKASEKDERITAKEAINMINKGLKKYGYVVTSGEANDETNEMLIVGLEVTKELKFSDELRVRVLKNNLLGNADVEKIGFNSLLRDGALEDSDEAEEVDFQVTEEGVEHTMEVIFPRALTVKTIKRLIRELGKSYVKAVV